MLEQGRELRPTENVHTSEVCAYSLEAIIALQKALDGGIPEQFLVTIPGNSDVQSSPATSSSPAPSLVPPSVGTPVRRGEAGELLAVIRHPGRLLAWIKKSFARHRRAIQKSA
jgi:hypothetical protein